MSGAAILLAVVAVLVWALAARRLWRAARRAGERSRMIYLCILAWPVLAIWLCWELAADLIRAARVSRRRLP